MWRGSIAAVLSAACAKPRIMFLPEVGAVVEEELLARPQETRRESAMLDRRRDCVRAADRLAEGSASVDRALVNNQ